MSQTFTWDGLYLGANFGAGIGDNSVTNSQTNTGPLAGLLGSIGGSDNQSRQRGFVYGGQVGFNKQIGGVVVGLEAEFDWSNIKARSQTSSTLPLIAQSNASSSEAQLKWLGLLQGRLGLALGRWMPYVVGGAAVGNVATRVSTAGNIGAISFGTGSADDSSTKWGWTIGGGFEVAVAPKWSVKAQYNYVDLGHASGAYAGSSFGTTRSTFNYNSEYTYHIVKAGVNYRF